MMACYPQARLKALLPKASLAPMNSHTYLPLCSVFISLSRRLRTLVNIGEPCRLNQGEIRQVGRWVYVCTYEWVGGWMVVWMGGLEKG